MILAEFNTHRAFSRNSASSRAIPVEKNMLRVAEAPFVPVAFTKNQRGMQAAEVVNEAEQERAISAWNAHLSASLAAARELVKAGVHKQHANRVLEAHAWHTVVVTATEWDNFWGQRDDTNAQPEMQIIAGMMHRTYDASEPVLLRDGEWHLPYVNKKEELSGAWVWKTWARISAARCARVSTLTQDGKVDIGADLSLYDRLVGPGHMSPLEHVARPMTADELYIFRQPVYAWSEESESWVVAGPDTHFLGNVQGWVQLRKLIRNEHNFSLLKNGGAR
jgi:hypothetical protein